jgi:hypothetical protein
MAAIADLAYIVVLGLLIFLSFYLYKKSQFMPLRILYIIQIILIALFLTGVKWFSWPGLLHLIFERISRYAALGLIITGIVACIATFISEKETKLRIAGMVLAILPFLLLFLLTTVCGALLGFGPCTKPA